MKDCIKEYKSILEKNGVKEDSIYDGIDNRICCLYQLINKHFHVKGLSIFTYVSMALFILCICLTVFFAKAFPILNDIDKVTSLSEKIGMLKQEITYWEHKRKEFENSLPSNKVPILYDEKNEVYYIPLPENFKFSHSGTTTDGRTAIIVNKLTK